MDFNKEFFRWPMIETYTANAKLLLIYFLILTDNEKKVIVTWSRLECETGLKGSDLSKAMLEIDDMFKWEPSVVTKLI